MRHTVMTTVATFTLGIAALLMTAGCGNGGGLSSLFGGSGGSDTFAALGGGSSSGGGGSSSGGSSGGFSSNPATIHHPEPASMVLFGSGLVGAGLMSRRRRKRAGKRA